MIKRPAPALVALLLLCGALPSLRAQAPDSTRVGGAQQLAHQLARTPFKYAKLKEEYSDIHTAHVVVNGSGQVTQVSWKPALPKAKGIELFEQSLMRARVTDTAGSYAVPLYLCDDSLTSARLTIGLMPDTNAPAPRPFDFVTYDQMASITNREKVFISAAFIQEMQTFKYRGIKGNGFFRLLISRKGAVVFVYYITMPSDKFYKAFVPFMKQGKYKPSMVKGEPVDGWITVFENFRY